VPVEERLAMDAERASDLGDGERAPSVLEAIAEERQQALRDVRFERFDDLARTAVILCDVNGRAERDADVIDAAKDEVVHAGASELEDVARGVGGEAAVGDDGDAGEELPDLTYDTKGWCSMSVAEVDDDHSGEPVRDEN
jgi:hypothetical protein